MEHRIWSRTALVREKDNDSGPETRTSATRYDSSLLLNLTEPWRLQSEKTVAPTSQTCEDCPVLCEAYNTALEGGCDGHHPSGSPTESVVSL